jgi:general secretion pathway protein G
MTSTLERLNERRKQDEGFTLIELLVVIVIIGILAGVVVFAVSGITDKGQDNACAADLKAVRTAAEAYLANSDNGSYPATEAAMVPGFLSETSDLTVYTAGAPGSGGRILSYTVVGQAPDCG